MTTETKTTYTFTSTLPKYEKSTLVVEFTTTSDGEMWWSLHRLYRHGPESALSLDLDEAEFLVGILAKRRHPVA